MTAFRKW